MSKLVFLIIIFFISSCGGGRLATENKRLKARVADLELKIYELTESPTHLLKEVENDVDLLMVNPTYENLLLSIELIDAFKSSYPTNNSIYKLEIKKQEIEKMLNEYKPKKQNINRTSYIIGNDGKEYKKVKIQFSIEVSEKSLGFVNVKLTVSNMSNTNVANLWLKASAVGKDGKVYGITQDFFFNRLNANQEISEVLSWEYVKAEEIFGFKLSQMRLSQNRNNRMLTEEECIPGNGNVKIFLDF